MKEKNAYPCIWCQRICLSLCLSVCNKFWSQLYQNRWNRKGWNVFGDIYAKKCCPPIFFSGQGAVMAWAEGQKGMCMYHRVINMHVPTYLLALHVHGPRFTTPYLTTRRLTWISEKTSGLLSANDKNVQVKNYLIKCFTYYSWQWCCFVCVCVCVLKWTRQREKATALKTR